MADPRDPVVRAAFGRRLRALRKAYGAGVGDTDYGPKLFAAALGIDSERYGRWERGEMEPPLGELANIGKVTGVSLDMLIRGEETPGRTNMIPERGLIDGDLTLGDRLRLARELREPSITKAAETMNVDASKWSAWASGAEQPPVGKMEEFAHRWQVSLDYLYRGLLGGVALDIGLELNRIGDEMRTAAGARIRRSRKQQSQRTGSKSQ
jgi:transcriptional regulator with XRE-family HTH domain